VSTENIITLVIAVGGLITAVWTARSTATKAELESLRQTINSLQQENARLQMQNEKLRGRVEELEKKSDEQDAIRLILADRVRAVEAENVELKTQVNQLQCSNDRLEVENKKLRARITELERMGRDGGE
jgi:regulator of replication initiation timing